MYLFLEQPLHQISILVQCTKPALIIPMWSLYIPMICETFSHTSVTSGAVDQLPDPDGTQGQLLFSAEEETAGWTADWSGQMMKCSCWLRLPKKTVWVPLWRKNILICKWVILSYKCNNPMDNKRKRLDDKNNFNIKTYHSILCYDPSRLKSILKFFTIHCVSKQFKIFI